MDYENQHKLKIINDTDELFITYLFLLYEYVYVVSESETIGPSEIVDTLKAMPLPPGGPIIILPCL